MSERRTRRRLRRSWLSEEEGFTIVELVASLSVLSVAFLSLTMAAHTGLRSVAQARQRQAASELANGSLEHLRNIPFDTLALDDSDATLAYSSDPDDPDHSLDPTADAYDYKGTGSYEPLVIAPEGSFVHKEDVDVGTTQLTVFRYVTWVDDPDITGTQDYKRLVLIVTYRVPVNTGRPRSVQVSGLLSPGNVLIPGEALDATEGLPGVPDPAPTATPSGSCSSDTTGPSATLEILTSTGADDGYTASTVVTLRMTASDPCGPITVRFSNDGGVYSDPLTYDASNPTATWTLSAGEGPKTVYAQFKDGMGNTRTVGPENVTLDTIHPTVPGSLTKTLSCSGQNRTATLSWGGSIDTNLQGYRLYRSIDNGTYAVVATTSGTSAGDTHQKNLDSVAFKAVAYDKAGNESDPTNVVALSKNQCS